MRSSENESLDNLLIKGRNAFESNHFELAKNIFELILSKIPDELNALNFLGLIYLQKKDFHLSEKYFLSALEKDNSQAIIFNNYANLLKEFQRWSDSINAYEKAIKLDGGSAEIHSNLGLVFHQIGQWTQALASYEKAINLNPEYLPSFYNLANTLKALEQYEDALVIYKYVYSKKPDDINVLINLGLTLKDLGCFEEALENLKAAIELAQNSSEGHLNLGNVYFDLAKFDLAIKSYNQALKINPKNADALTNRGNIYYCLKDFRNALNDHNQALMIKPELANANWNKALTLLMCGDYFDGWKMYEWRHEIHKMNLGYKPNQFSAPLWLGLECLENKTILIHSEQGLGDTIQFCRFIPKIWQLGAKIIFEVQNNLVELMDCLSPYANVISIGANETKYDFHIPLLSLPHALKIELNTIPSDLPYLKAAPDKVEFWRDKLSLYKVFRVGIVWSGGFRPNQPEVRSVHLRRNIPLKAFEGFHIPNIALYSLQKGQPAENELLNLENQNWAGPTIINFTENLKDFSDTAAFIMNLDLVISVDTSSAHLAASLGKPVWLLNRFDSCWRWMAEGNSTAWYPTMRIYRQSQIENWGQVIDKVKDDLRELVDNAIVEI
jgi:tetratricopeptide (TPR) repeat protein